jgi:bifunctional DNA-binding transcriptional regulator/antitoxin component of YhaV-PrlF toxin-antitoxin module
MHENVVPGHSTIVRLRRKNQLTLPEAALREIGAEIGDRLLVSAEDGVIRLEPIRSTYAGSLSGLWPADWLAELRRERDSWQP